MNGKPTSPFGPAALKARSRTSILPMDSCAAPVELFERLSRHRRGRGAVLMESAAQGAPAGVRSLVIPEGLIRLVIRGSTASYSPLTPRGVPLIESLTGRLPKTESREDSVVARFPDFDKNPALPDAERVRAASVLDGVRALAGLVEDEEPDEDLLPPGLYGAFSYEAVDLWEELPPRRPDPLGEPDANFVFALDAISFDHVRGEVRVVTRSPVGPRHRGNRDEEERHRFYVEALEKNGSPPDNFGDRVAPEKDAEPDVSDEAFKSSVEKFLSHVLAGDIFQGVLSRGLWMESTAPPLAVYRALRSRNPSPYMFYVDLGDGELLGASPETCLKVERGEVMIRPIAGTAPRGLGPDGRIDEELDARLAVSLILDTKEQAEHAMLVDLARNDVARVSVPGTRQVTEPFSVEKYSHVQHLVSGVKGTLLPGLDALHAYVASANMGTLTGAPKLRAMELIRETEPSARGYYGGAVGYLLQDGTFDSCIVIRTLRHRDGKYLTRTGAGIVADSIPEKELEETIHKARACRVAISLAEGRQA
ncbi:MAG TPA: chorismate-binding protein [Vicinamibacteria bacterium]